MFEYPLLNQSNRFLLPDSVRSPKEKRRDNERERSNHERSGDPDKKSRGTLNNSVSRSNKYEKRSGNSAAEHSAATANEWSEHISSSGKKYYYNCVSEVSQWEKPRDWDARRTSSKDSSYSSRNSKCCCLIMLAPLLSICLHLFHKQLPASVRWTCEM